MAAFDEKFSDQQRDAAAHARADLKMTYRRVVELAAAGELTHNGEKVGPFKISPEYVRDLALALTRRRTGQAASKLVDLPHNDAMEALRRRAVSCADKLLEHYESRQDKRPGDAEPKRLREIMEVIRYAQQLGSPSSRAPSSQTRDENGKKYGPDTRRGAVGTLLRDHRAASEPAPNVSTGTTDNGVNTRQTAGMSTPRPGSLALEQGAS